MRPSADLILSVPPDDIDRIEAHVETQLSGRVRNLHIELHENGLVIRGQTHTYFAKQLAQASVMHATSLPIAANLIEVE
jgi:hypothetical protein